MPTVFWDASALTKRYSIEVGSATVDALFGLIPASPMIGTVLGYAETFSSLLRKRNRGAISAFTFTGAKALLRSEVVNNPDFILLTVDDAAIFAGVALMERYNINSADAAILALFLRYIQAQPVGAAPCVLVASDGRLITAADAEGLKTLNPETVAAADVPAFLARV